MEENAAMGHLAAPNKNVSPKQLNGMGMSNRKGSNLE